MVLYKEDSYSYVLNTVIVHNLGHLTGKLILLLGSYSSNKAPYVEFVRINCKRIIFVYRILYSMTNATCCIIRNK